jgi:alpha-mannosidase
LTEAGLLDTDNPDIAVSTWKMAEDGNGTVLRLQETAGAPAHVRVRSAYFQFLHAWKATTLEDNLSEIPVQDGAIEVSMKPFETLTLRVQTASATQ